MGFGFRCGFLGLLHMEIVQQRLEREYDLDLITTAPSVVYRVTRTDGEVVSCDNPSDLPDAAVREFIEEPCVVCSRVFDRSGGECVCLTLKMSHFRFRLNSTLSSVSYVALDVIAPSEFTGSVMELAQERRGTFKSMSYLAETRCTLSYELPLAEVIADFFDELKSRTRGYASMEFSLIGYRRSDLVLLEVKINGDPCDPLAVICHRDKAYSLGKGLVAKLKELIPRQQFLIPIQAAIGTRVIASERISAMRKDVLAKCYGASPRGLARECGGLGARARVRLTPCSFFLSLPLSLSPTLPRGA